MPRRLLQRPRQRRTIRGAVEATRSVGSTFEIAGVTQLPGHVWLIEVYLVPFSTLISQYVGQTPLPCSQIEKIRGAL